MKIAKDPKGLRWGIEQAIKFKLDKFARNTIH